MPYRPAHARNFRGKAKNIPERDTFMLSYQDEWIADKSLMKIMEKSRRIGISYGSSYEDVRYHSQSSATLDTYVSSRDEVTAREYVRYCTKFAQVLDKAARDMGQRVINDDGDKAQVIEFASRTSLFSLTSNPDAFAGKGGRVKLDEFALRKDPRLVYSIAGPTIDWGGTLAIISTHRGSANYFNTLIQEIKHKGNPKGFSLHRVTLQDALDRCFLWKLQTRLPEGDPRLEMDEAAYFDYQRGRAADAETFAQEYMCVPSDDAATFLTYELISSCHVPAGEAWETDLEQAQELYVGVDIGRDHDLTVIWVVERLGDVFFTRRVIEMKAQTFEAQRLALYEILELPRVRRCCIDRTGIGRQFAEEAQHRFGTYKVEQVNFSGPVKEELAFPLRAAFEDRSVRIPDREAITADLRAIKKDTTASGNIRFAADRGKNGHADRFWALALAIHAGKNPTVSTMPISFPRRGVSERRNREVLV
jgi:phage FluMu gp28-like protein